MYNVAQNLLAMWSIDAQERPWNKTGGMTASTASDLLEHSRVANQRPRLQLLRGCIMLLARQLKCFASERPLECLSPKCPLKSQQKGYIHIIINALLNLTHTIPTSNVVHS